MAPRGLALSYPTQARVLLLVGVGVVNLAIYPIAHKTRSNTAIELMSFITIPLGTAVFLVIFFSALNGDFGQIGGLIPLLNQIIGQITTTT